MKPIIFLTGHYGSGKTEIALNLAIKDHYHYLIDLDIMNPYFRSREYESLLKEHQVELISSDHEQTMYTGVPFISKRIYEPFIKNDSAIYDLGGSDLGAILLNQFKAYFDRFELWFVVNPSRPETAQMDQIMDLALRIESSTGKKITGIINNTNWLSETKTEDIMAQKKLFEELSMVLDIPIIFNVIEENLEMKEADELNQKYFSIHRYLK